MRTTGRIANARPLLLGALLVLCFQFVSPASEGSECNIRGQRGVCRLRKDCRTAQTGRQQLCSYDANFNAVVCCPNSRPQNKQERRKPGVTAMKMCAEYVKYVPKPESGVLSFAEPEMTCQKASASPLIVGGEEASPKEFEHMALIGYGDEDNIQYLCGGSLISPDFVLTAAHCATLGNKRARWVLLGELNMDIDWDDADPQLIAISNISRHGGYQWKKHYNDIALMKLSRPATMTQYVRPACLYTEETRNDDPIFVASGWGQVNNDGDRTGQLMKVTLPLQPFSVCKSSYQSFSSSSQLSKGILNETQFCAGEDNSGKDTCPGDSGGPLQMLTAEEPYFCMFHIVGITSFGKLTCGDSPAVYTRVSAYLQWIEDIVWPER